VTLTSVTLNELACVCVVTWVGRKCKAVHTRIYIYASMNVLTCLERSMLLIIPLFVGDKSIVHASAAQCKVAEAHVSKQSVKDCIIVGQDVVAE